MNPIQEASDINNEQILTFNGFLGLVLYTSVHEELRQFLLNSYPDLHYGSGGDLLLILCEAIPAETIEELKPPSLSFVTGLSTNISDFGRARVVDELRRKFGLNNKDLPCLVFFSSAQSKVAYRLPLGLDKLEYRNTFAKVCDAAHKVASETPPPYGETAEEYKKWREDCFKRLFPCLRLMHLGLTVKKWVTQAPLGQIASALKIARGL